LELICKSGQNSPAARPEFVDISLNATATTDATIDTQQETTEEEDAIESDNENEGE
jgi:hypothetical protein